MCGWHKPLFSNYVSFFQPYVVFSLQPTPAPTPPPPHPRQNKDEHAEVSSKLGEEVPRENQRCLSRAAGLTWLRKPRVLESSRSWGTCAIQGKRVC